MRKIRVLIVDDAVVIRRLVSDILSSDPEIEVVGTAANGSIGLAKIPQVNPDLITLDIEMPGMSGLETLAELRKTYPVLPVVMFSTLTERGASATLDALALGASDYVTKPANVGSVSAAQQAVRDTLVPKIKGLCARLLPQAFPPAPLPAPRAPLVPRPGARIDALVIGVSTGGPNALAELVPQLPATLGVPVLIVQHMPPVFTKLLAERLDAKAPLRVAEGRTGELVVPDVAWIAPGGDHMVVARDGVSIRLRLNQDPPRNSCRPAVDPLFESAAEVWGAGTLAVVLTGMGQDGLRGCEAVREAGGHVLIQDEASSVVWGMPGAVARAGLADATLPLGLISTEIVRRIRAGHAATRRAPSRPEPGAVPTRSP
jgi:two-component system, chemotaxis family, protein-glutamate methylesterase/glutaminase